MNCRACFKICDPVKDSITKLNELEEKHGKSLGKLLSDCTGLQCKIIEEDIICVTCKEYLLDFYTFRNKVLDTNEKFLQLAVNSIKQEILPSEIEHVDIKVFPTCIKRKRHLEPSRIENVKKYKRNNDGLFECPKETCPGIFKSLGRLEIHLENMHSEKHQSSFVCEMCGEEFLTLLLKNRHYFKFHAPRPYICEICGATYPIIDSLRTHMAIRHVKKKKVNDSKYPCSICNKLYSTEGGMLHHRKQVHFPKELLEKPFVCDICGSCWPTKSKLVAHMKHHQVPSYICDICKKRFSVKGSLLNHIQNVHSDIRRFFCDICGKNYKTKSGLQNHRTSHSDERPFKCGLCPASFKLKSGLQEHEQKKHTILPPISCNICGKLFKMKSTLRVHMRQHDGIDMPCPHCNLTYRCLDSIKFHIKTIHMGYKKRHACTICLINLSSRKQIVEHLELIHKISVKITDETDLIRSYWTTHPSGDDLGEGNPKVVIKRT